MELRKGAGKGLTCLDQLEEGPHASILETGPWDTSL